MEGKRLCYLLDSVVQGIDFFGKVSKILNKSTKNILRWRSSKLSCEIVTMALSRGAAGSSFVVFVVVVVVIDAAATTTGLDADSRAASVFSGDGMGLGTSSTFLGALVADSVGVSSCFLSLKVSPWAGAVELSALAGCSAGDRSVLSWPFASSFGTWTVFGASLRVSEEIMVAARLPSPVFAAFAFAASFVISLPMAAPTFFPSVVAIPTTVFFTESDAIFPTRATAPGRSSGWTIDAAPTTAANAPLYL